MTLILLRLFKKYQDISKGYSIGRFVSKPVKRCGFSALQLVWANKISLPSSTVLKICIGLIAETVSRSFLEKPQWVHHISNTVDVTSTLISLVITSISDHSTLLDSFVVVYAAFIASLHKIMGIDFAAHFVQSAVASYEKYYDAMQQNSVLARGAHSASPSVSVDLSAQIEQQNDGKECSNLLVLISELYNFQVISSVLVFDVIRTLLEGDLTEFKVELLLKLLRSKSSKAIVSFFHSSFWNTCDCRLRTSASTWRPICFEGYRQHRTRQSHRTEGRNQVSEHVFCKNILFWPFCFAE